MRFTPASPRSVMVRTYFVADDLILQVLFSKGDNHTIDTHFTANNFQKTEALI